MVLAVFLANGKTIIEPVPYNFCNLILLILEELSIELVEEMLRQLTRRILNFDLIGENSKSESNS